MVRITENYRVPTGAPQRRPTGMGKALGTPGYLPLEAGLVALNSSFDVFGLGATLYQLLTGKLPEEPFAPLREAHPGCDAPDDLERVLIAALALEPEDRTQTAAQLRRALRAVQAAHPDHGVPSMRIDGRYELIGLAGTGAKADACVGPAMTSCSNLSGRGNPMTYFASRARRRSSRLSGAGPVQAAEAAGEERPSAGRTHGPASRTRGTGQTSDQDTRARDFARNAHVLGAGRGAAGHRRTCARGRGTGSNAGRLVRDAHTADPNSKRAALAWDLDLTH